jgi:hypothetical protein
MFYVCFVGKDEKLNDSIDDDDCFDEQIYLTNFCSFKLFHLFLWKKLNIFKHKMNICVPLLKPGFNNLERGFSEHFTEPEK